MIKFRRIVISFIIGTCALLNHQNSYSQVSIQDSLALVDLYANTGGDDWLGSLGWKTGPATNWQGITVDSGYVTGISLDYNNLTGTLPTSLGNITRLKKLSLAGNKIAGTIPSSLGTLSKLEYLDLTKNLFNGTIPQTLGNLDSLRELYLSNCKLTGVIPATFENLIRLKSLLLNNNLLSGNIPAFLGNFTDLETLVLSHNQFTGSLPSSLGNLDSLLTLAISSNQLTGAIPASLGNLDNLMALYLNNNQLTGSIPTSLCNLPALGTLDLYENKLTGNIPGNIGNLVSLDMLNLSYNQLTGPIPFSLGDLKGMSILDISNNQLNGTVPSSLVNLAGFAAFSIAYNNLTFEGMESVASNINLTYAPQNAIALHYSNHKLSVSAGGTLANNTYELFKNGYTIASKTGDSTFLDLGAGVYNVHVTNSIANKLTLYVEDTYINSPVLVKDSLVLVDLYNKMNGAGWSNPWNLSAPISTWDGVSTEGGKVVKLLLYDKNLIGSIPASIGDLDKLTHLYLSRNYITGALPSSLGNLLNLVHFEATNNQLTGAVPAAFGNCINLQVLDLSYNQLSDSIPSSLGNLHKLERLNLDENNIPGVIPSSLGNMQQLQFLVLNNNSLTGSIPPSLGNLSHLKTFDLNNNQLTGEIPSTLDNFPDLLDINVSYNQLSGKVPASLNVYPASFNLNIKENNFTFDGLEELAAHFIFATYSPQADIPLHYTGDILSVSAGGTLKNNTYTWYNSQGVVATKNGDSTLSVTETGDYYVVVTNSIATNLQLHSTTLKAVGPVLLCPPLGNGNISYLPLDLGLHQWQIDKGSGFANISNDQNFAGATTENLQLKNIPEAWNGYKLRCLLNGNPGDVFTIKFADKWTGAGDNNWENPNNWSCMSIPGPNTNVTINSGTVNINSNTIIYSLTAAPGVIINVKPGVKLTITH